LNKGVKMGKRFYDEKEGMSPKDREGYYNKMVRWVVEHAYNNAPAVREKLDQIGLRPSQINTIEDLQRIPVTPASKLIEAQRANPPFGGFLAVPPDSLKRIFMAMGPEIVPMGFSGSFYERSAKALYAAGIRKGDILLNTSPYHPTYAGFVVDEGAGRLGVTIIPSGPGNIDLKIEVIQRLKPTVILATANFFMAIVKRAEELGYDLRDSTLRLAMIGGEMVTPSTRKLIEEDYKITITDIYGVAGIGTVAYECNHKNGKHIADEVLLEVLDPVSGKKLGPGEPGEAVITQFDEFYPLIRFGTGDLVAYTDEPCPCGRTSNRLTAFLGRAGEAIKVRQLFLHPKQLEQAIAQIPQVSQFQAVVIQKEHRDVLDFNIELEDDQVDIEEVQERLRERVHEICRLKTDNIYSVPRGTIPEGSKRIIDNRVWE